MRNRLGDGNRRIQPWADMETTSLGRLMRARPDRAARRGAREGVRPHRIADTIAALADQQDTPEPDHQAIRARALLADCNTKLARHRAALEEGADPKIVTGWIAEVELERRRALAVLNQPTPKPAQRMTQEQISDLVSRLGDILTVLREADPADRAEVYQQLRLRLTYHPAEQKVRVQAQPDADSYGKKVRVRGPSFTLTT